MNKNPYEPVKVTKEEFKKFYKDDEPKPMAPEEFAKQFPQYVNKDPKPVNNDLLNKELQVPKELQVQNEQQVKNEIKNEEVKKDEKKEIEMALV